MTVLLSLHDVAPPFERQVRVLWDLCFGLGVRPALVVVPDWHGAHPLDRNRRFVDWLFARADQGARILLHGERHDQGTASRGIAEEWRAMGRPVRAGEFRTLDYTAAAARISRGITTLARCGLSPVGFVPPAWLSRPAARDAARDAGLRLAEDARRIYLLQEGISVPAPALRWNAPFREAPGEREMVAESRWRAPRRAPLSRLALHPTDLDDARTRGALERALTCWLAREVGDGYGALLAPPAPSDTRDTNRASDRPAASVAIGPPGAAA